MSEKTDATWDDISEKAPDLPRGWFELSRISPQDRVEFTRDFWLDRLPFNPQTHEAFEDFFKGLNDVAVVLTRRREEEPMDAELVYSLEDNSSFFRGKPPAHEGDLAELKSELGVALPRDYLSFARIHNGFGKLSEMGLLEVGELADAKRRVMELVMNTDRLAVDPGSLFPFYEVLGMSSFQCFYSDWYPGSEMGNVYLSGIDYTISDTAEKKSAPDHLAFATFSEWLAYYLQGMIVSP
ncbi:MAG TPA: SMI1/KNR4 family protein [Chlamydiales bacterium]|nr:SMI1/KNR4 family protein [Chlamydiales bacterium]